MHTISVCFISIVESLVHLLSSCSSWPRVREKSDTPFKSFFSLGLRAVAFVFTKKSFHFIFEVNPYLGYGASIYLTFFLLMVWSNAKSKLVGRTFGLTLEHTHTHTSTHNT